MNFGNCKCCNTMIKYDKIPVCSNCLDKYYLQVREYIYKNGISSPQELHEATNVPLKVIDYFIQNGSLYDENKKDDEQENEIMERRKTIDALKELRNSIEHENVKEESKKNNFNKAEMHFINRR